VRNNYVDVLIGSIAGLACLSILSICSAQKSVEKPQLVSTFPRARVAGMPGFSSRVQKLRFAQL